MYLNIISLNPEQYTALFNNRSLILKTKHWTAITGEQNTLVQS